MQVDGTTLRSRVKDDQTSPATWRDPSAVLFQLGDSARTSVPAGDAYGFLGRPGATVWTIGQTQQDDVPWLGWNTQHPTAVRSIDGPTTWTLDAVDGPGDVFVYQTGSFGALTRVFGTADGWPRSAPGPRQRARARELVLHPAGHLPDHHHPRRDADVRTPGHQHRDPPGAGRAVRRGRPEADVAARGGPSAHRRRRRGDPRRGVTVEPRRTTAGATVSVRVPNQQPGSWLMPVAYSTPRQLGWSQVTATRQHATVTSPPGSPPAGTGSRSTTRAERPRAGRPWW